MVKYWHFFSQTEMTERFKRLKKLEQIAEQIEVADTDVDGVDHPVISSFYEMLFQVAGRIQPILPSYKAAQRILDVIERGGLPDEISTNDLESVFHAAGANFERIVGE